MALVLGLVEVGAWYCYCIFKLFPVATFVFFYNFVVCFVCAVFGFVVVYCRCGFVWHWGLFGLLFTFRLRCGVP